MAALHELPSHQDHHSDDDSFKYAVDPVETNGSGSTEHEVNPTSLPNDIEYHQNELNSGDIQHAKSHPQCETFVMPGDLFINFNSTPSKSSQTLPKNDKLQNLLFGHSSTPASPEETEHRVRGKLTKKDTSFHSPLSEKKSTFSYNTGFVRTSKSEDHLQKSSLTTVNIDIDDEMASSLNTLLDTKQDNVPTERIVWSCTTPVSSSERLPSPDYRETPDSSVSLSPTSSETSSPSKGSIKKADSSPRTSDRSGQQSDSSESEMIPSDSSTTIRKDDNSEYSEAECTSEQISAISSLEDGENPSANGSDLGSPMENLSPTIDNLCHEDWVADLDTKETAIDHDLHSCIPESKTLALKNKSNHTLPYIQVDLTNGVLDHKVHEVSTERSIPSKNSMLSISKLDAQGEQSIGSPTSFGSEDTFGELSYHELLESYDEDSSTEVEDDSGRSDSPTDDESDIESLHSFHYSPKAVDMPSASRLAKRLYNLEGFKKTDVSRHLSKNNEFSRVVAEEYLRFFDFISDPLDIALRKFLKKFCLIGETQERERVLVHFSKRYLDCNPGAFRSQDAAHTLTCALMLLNSDLHGENLCRKMVCGEFIENLAELNDGENFQRDVLKSLYYSIKNQPLEWAVDSDDEDKGPQENLANLQESKQCFVGHNPFLEVPNPNCATEYKKGYVMRKCCVDPSGKKTPLGKRGWKMLYATLRDLVLYLHKDEHGFKKNQLYDSLHNSIRIHHALATKAADYTKKQCVFRLRTADQAEYLFQTSDSKELQSWVDTINLVAASLSAPPLASAVGSQKKFQRPLLPVSHTRLNLREQLHDHDNRIIWLEKELEEHLSRTPERSNRSRFVHEFAEKEQYLQYELTRYRTYAFLLRSKMAQYPELELPLVETSIGEVDEPSEKGDHPSSPTKSPVHANRAAGVKRSMSERYSYRTPVFRSNSVDGCG